MSDTSDLYAADPNPAVRDLRKGLQAALHEVNVDLEIPEHFVGVRGFYEDNLKVNKLAYRAIDHFNLPILHTWFRYGQWEPQDALRPKHLDPSPLSDPDNYERYDHPQKNPPTRQEIKGYLLTEGIEEMMEQPLFDFLENNYQELAPKDFKEVYLSNLEILRVLEWFWGDEQRIENIDDHHQEFREASIDLQYKLHANPYFGQETQDHVENGLFAIEDVFIALRNESEPSPSQIRTARRARELYHSEIWPIPAYTISIREAGGPETEVEGFREQGEKNLDDLKRNAPEELQSWKEKIRNRNLRPLAEDYHATDGDIPKCFVSFEKNILKSSYD